MGYSRIAGGLTLVWKRVELALELLVRLMVFFSGALVLVDRLPTWRADIGRFSPIRLAIRTGIRASDLKHTVFAYPTSASDLSSML